MGSLPGFVFFLIVWAILSLIISFLGVVFFEEASLQMIIVGAALIAWGISLVATIIRSTPPKTPEEAAEQAEKKRLAQERQERQKVINEGINARNQAR